VCPRHCFARDNGASRPKGSSSRRERHLLGVAVAQARREARESIDASGIDASGIDADSCKFLQSDIVN
jgi:hypothetical protein